jgi:hypothetical protein
VKLCQTSQPVSPIRLRKLKRGEDGRDERGGEQLSTIDLFGPHFVMLAGRDGDAWRQAVHLIEPSWPPLIGFTIGKEEDLSGRRLA